MPLPRVFLFDQQSAHQPDLHWLRRLAESALPACLEARTRPDAPLATLEEIEITFVDDSTIARVHAEFLQDATPTDVITFHHGEIVISTQTAWRQAREHGQDLDHELALYVVHGLLHLAGWDDHGEAEAAAMAETQTAILKTASRLTAEGA